jgi:type III pantothenate kinase
MAKKPAKASAGTPQGGGSPGVHVVVDVGNTESVLGLFAETDGAGASLAKGLPGAPTLLGTWRYATSTSRTPDELLLLIRAFLAETGAVSPLRAVIGSVVPAQTELLRVAMKRLVQGPVFVVDPDSDLPIRLEVDEPRTVGADRIVNTLAAAHLFRRDTIVVDLGTATTYDCITADGAFLGGVIAPGLLAGQEWLAGRTAKLPRVELRPPDRVIGTRTEACLQAGIFYSAVDAIDGIVRRIRAEWERPEALVVATGGFAPTLALHSATIERVEPYLTLAGLEMAGRHMANPGGAGLQ